MFKSVASSELKGLIFTIVWAFNKDDWGYIEEISKIFTDQGGEIYLIELEAHLDERLKRNTTENRLLHKPSKRTIADSEGRIRKSSEEYRLNSMPGEITNKNYIRIDNTNLSAEEVARKIHTAFDL